MTGNVTTQPAPRVQLGQLLRDRRVALKLDLAWLCKRLRAASTGPTECLCGWIVVVEAGQVTPSSLELVEWAAALELPVEALYVPQAGEV